MNGCAPWKFRIRADRRVPDFRWGVALGLAPLPDDYDALLVGRDAVRRLSWRQLRAGAPAVGEQAIPESRWRLSGS